jgi:hypothetical protein
MAESIITRRKSGTGGGEAPGSYSTWVVQDEDNVKYTIYNGYDIINNPTPPTTNLSFNQWIRNDGATGSVVLSNVNTIISGEYNSSVTSVNESNMTQLIFSDAQGNPAAPFSSPFTAINNGYIFIAGEQGSGNTTILVKYDTNVLVNTASVGFLNITRAIGVNNGFVYLANSPSALRKYSESTLSFIGNVITGGSNSIAFNGGFLFTTNGSTNLRKINEETLATSATVAAGVAINNIAVNGSFVYVGGNAANGVRRHRTSDLVFVNNTGSLGLNTNITSIVINAGFIYVGSGQAAQSTNAIRKFRESNFQLIGQTSNLNSGIFTLTISNGFIYAGPTSRKFNESTLGEITLVNVGPHISSVADTNHVYLTNDIGSISKYTQKEIITAKTPYYEINKIKAGG